MSVGYVLSEWVLSLWDSGHLVAEQDECRVIDIALIEPGFGCGCLAQGARQHTGDSDRGGHHRFDFFASRASADMLGIFHAFSETTMMGLNINIVIRVGVPVGDIIPLQPLWDGRC